MLVANDNCIVSMKIGNLAKLVAKCWTSAEEAVRREIEQRHHDSDEEFITALFRGELRQQCDQASSNGEVVRAFSNDLRTAFQSIPHQAVTKIGAGLVAAVHFHPREVEKKTGGDLGVVIFRPDVCYATGSRSELAIEYKYGRGLLCQAKVFKRASDWGKLSVKQRANLSKRLEYLALLLYRYADQDRIRNQLEPFKWQLTSNRSMKEINDWFRSDNFPNIQQSEEILLGLAQGQFGTDDKRLIEEFIIPTTRSTLEIHIKWGDGRGPGRKLDLRQSEYASQGKQYVRASL